MQDKVWRETLGREMRVSLPVQPGIRPQSKSSQSPCGQGLGSTIRVETNYVEPSFYP